MPTKSFARATTALWAARFRAAVDPGERPEDALARRRLGVEVLVDDDARVQQDDRPPLGEPLDDVVDELAVLRGVGERVAEVETDGGELLGEPGRRFRLDPRPVDGAVEEVAHRERGLPDVAEQAVQELRVEERTVAPGLADRGVEHLLVPGAHRDLLLEAAGLRPELERLPAEVLGGDVVEDVHVAPRQALVPGRRAAPGDDRDVGGGDSVLLEEPVQERDPVQDLEADLAEPGADDDVSVGGADRRQRLADQLLGAAGDRGVDELWVVGRHLDGLQARAARTIFRACRAPPSVYETPVIVSATG